MAVHPRTVLVDAFRRYEKDNHRDLRADPAHKRTIRRARQAIREGAHTMVPLAVAALALPKERIVAILRWWERRHLGDQGSGREQSERCADLAARIAQGKEPAVDSWMLLQAIRGDDLTMRAASGDDDVDMIETHRWPCGHTMRRETGVCPVGNAFTGCWVLRDAAGAFVDYDLYRNDIVPRHGLSMTDPVFEAA